LGFNILEAENGKEAVDHSEAQTTVDVIILDWNMPVMDGMECMLQIRADAIHSPTQRSFSAPPRTSSPRSSKPS
jgi:CheY-like chemotaxis protein